MNQLDSNYKTNLAASSATYVSQLFQLFPHLTGVNEFGFPRTDEMPQTIGVSLLIVFLVILIHKSDDMDPTHVKMTQILLLSVIFCIILCTNMFPWWDDDDPILGFCVRARSSIQFPWRFLGSIAFILVVFICYTSSNFKDDFFRGAIPLVLIFFSVFVGLYTISTVRTDNPAVNFQDLAGCGDIYGIMNGEYLPSNVDLHNLSNSYFNGSIQSSNCFASIKKKSDLNLTLLVKDAKKDDYVVLPRLYYPYYQFLDSDLNDVASITNDAGYVKVIFNSEFNGELKIGFVLPATWVLADHLSVLAVSALLFLFILLVLSFFRNRFKLTKPFSK